MSRQAAILATFRTLAEAAVKALDVELVDVRLATEGGERIARIVLDRERTDGLPGSGITLDDCHHVSRSIGTALDEDPEQEAASYRVEVSSPGLERPLVRLADFDRFCGRVARIKTFQPIDARRNFEGLLLGTEGQNVRIDCGGTIAVVPLDGIAKAHLVHKFH